MLDPDDLAELSRQARADRKREHEATHRALHPEQYDEPAQDWPNPNQPRCTAGANGIIAARKAIALAQERKETK